MLQTVKQKRDEGFTIIEVLIVLAIAGLIMVVVFLAVPALQRNSRNNQTKTEANNVLSSYSELVGNNGGSALTASVSTCTSTPVCDAKTVLTNAGVKTIVRVDVVAATTTAVSAPDTAKKDQEQAVIVLNSQCTSASSAVPKGGTSRQAAIIYWLETTGTTTQAQCVGA